VFDGNREAVLSGDCYKAGGYYFGVGIGVVRTNRSASDNFAKEKASQDAKANLICRKAVEDLVWPQTLDKQSTRVLAKLAARAVSVQADVSGIVDVSLEKTGPAVYTAVVAAPESKLKNVPRASFEEVKKCLLNPHWLKVHFKNSPKELYEFYQTQKELPESLVGISYANWDDAQLDLFCGIPHPNVCTNAIPSGPVQGEKNIGTKLPAKEEGVTGNLNETFDL